MTTTAGVTFQQFGGRTEIADAEAVRAKEQTDGPAHRLVVVDELHAMAGIVLPVSPDHTERPTLFVATPQGLPLLPYAGLRPRSIGAFP